MKLSIIIPIYNAEAFLSECLDSVCAQTLSDGLEIICINDGSTDCSLEILNGYKKNDSRIIVINQENGGVSAARNAGLEIAKGENIGFVDADDCIAPHYFEDFLSGSENIDLISKSLINKIGLPAGVVLQKKEIQNLVFPMMLETEDFNSVCVKVFKSKIIQQNKIRFPKKKLGEDAHFIMKFLQYASTCQLIDDKGGYYYRENLESATRRDMKDDYVIRRMFDEYYFDHQIEYELTVDRPTISRLKAQKLLTSFLSALSLYLRRNSILNANQRHKLVGEAMNELNKTEILQKYSAELTQGKGRFEHFIIKALQQNNLRKIKWAYRYAHWRNGI